MLCVIIQVKALNTMANNLISEGPDNGIRQGWLQCRSQNVPVKM
jgi:hypothetical protein